MTNEEKAKAYDEAKKRAQNAADSGMVSQNFVDDIFQPRESEDERMRKAALEGIEHLERNLGWDAIGDIDILDVKEYLEKQKEQKPAEYIPDSALQKIKRAITACENLSEYYKDREENIHQYYGGKAEGLQLALTYFGNENEQLLEEQKPAEKLSKEEYVKRFKALCDAHEIKLPNREYDIYHLCDDLSKLFIDSGKHKSSEWSEEDEEDSDITIYHPLKNGKGEYECIPYSFYGSLTSFSEDKDLIDFLRTCFYTEEECNEWIKQQKEQKQITWTDLTWKDIVELEGIINNVHYDFRNGIGQESFGKEVLERLRSTKGVEYLDKAEQKY